MEPIANSDSKNSGNRLSDRLDHVFKLAVENRRLVGAVGVVFHKGTIVYRKSHGWACLEKNELMGTETLFRFSSVTKPIVTAAMLKLVAGKQVRLDDPVTTWLPYFTPRGIDGIEPLITIHHLLCHTAGLGYSFQEPPESDYHQQGVSDGIDSTELSLNENLKRLSNTILRYTPGKSWNYSLALDVVGAVIEKVTGKALDVAIKELVLLPLGLKSSGFVCSPTADLAVPYANSGSSDFIKIPENGLVPLPEESGGAVRFSPSRVYDENAFYSGGAGMFGSADDVGRLLETLRHTNAFIPDEIREQAFYPHVDASAMTAGPGWGFGYGGALLLDPEIADTPQSKGTLAWGGVYGHSWFIDPEKELTAVLMTNTAYEGMIGKLTVDFRDAIYEGL